MSYFLLLIFVLRFIDGNLDLEINREVLTDKKKEMENQSVWLTLITDKETELDCSIVDFNFMKRGDVIYVYRSPWFDDIVAWSLGDFTSDSGIKYGSIDRPNKLHAAMELVVILCIIIGRILSRRFEFAVLFFLFTIIAATMRWWFLTL